MISVTDEELARVTAARAAFEEYAAFGGDPLAVGMSDERDRQIKLMRWSMKNFGVQQFLVFSAGIAEELGELIEAIASDDQEEVKDALGDVFVYACGWCGALRLDFEVIVDSFKVVYDTGNDGLRVWLDLWQCVGSLNHVALKNHQRIRGYDDTELVRRDAGSVLQRLLGIVCWFVFNNDWDARTVFLDTVDGVLKRDFTVNKLTGVAV